MFVFWCIFEVLVFVINLFGFLVWEVCIEEGLEGFVLLRFILEIGVDLLVWYEFVNNFFVGMWKVNIDIIYLIILLNLWVNLIMV